MTTPINAFSTVPPSKAEMLALDTVNEVRKNGGKVTGMYVACFYTDEDGMEDTLSAYDNLNANDLSMVRGMVDGDWFDKMSSRNIFVVSKEFVKEVRDGIRELEYEEVCGIEEGTGAESAT